jgi:hypothetical protein
MTTEMQIVKARLMRFWMGMRILLRTGLEAIQVKIYILSMS